MTNQNLVERMHDPLDVKQHLDHWQQLEVAIYGSPPISVTVECTQCGCIVQELYDARWEEDTP